MIDGYDLERDVASAGRALAGALPEAAVFYCGRALEATAARAVAALELEPAAQVFANLDTLERLSLVARPALYLGHALRRLANDARHVLRPLTQQDAQFATLCLEPWLRWYLRDYPRGPRRDADLGLPRPSGTTGALLDLLARAQATGEDVSDALLVQCDDGVAHFPALSAMVGESLISCGRADDAQAVLERALAVAPDDLRLNQLFALARRRAGHTEEALARLKALVARYPEDEETLGITAGALKAAQALDEAQVLYRKGWQTGRERNLYLGVNAAAILLWRGDARHTSLAHRLVEVFEGRNARLVRAGIDLAAQRDYYDQVTEAEARLLAGDGAAARTLYASAFRRFAARKGDIAGTKAQANRSIALLGGALLA